MKNPLPILLPAAALLALAVLAPAIPVEAQNPVPVMVITPQDPPASSAGPQEPEAAPDASLRKRLAQAQARLEEKLARAEAMRLRELDRQLALLPETIEASLDGLDEELRAHIEAITELASEAQEGARVFVDTWAGGGWLGVAIAEVTAEKARELRLPAERGVLVTEVQDDSPAARAGFQANDVITEYNGQRVEGVAQFTRMVRETPAGRRAQITVWRDGRSQTLTAELGSLESRIERRVREVEPRLREWPRFELRIPEFGGVFVYGRTPLLGIQAEDVRGPFGEFLGAPEGEGVLVREVREDSPAAKAGMRAGDVIFEAAGKRVRTLGDLRSVLREKREEKTVALRVVRRGQQVTLNVEIEPPGPPAERARPVRRTAI